MSDVMHGPKVSDGRRRRKTFLIAFIDDATRVIPFAAFAYSENTTAFLPVLKQAIARRGLPARLYCDNGANFRSQQLALVCAKLGVALIHARPYQPAGKGKIERFFRTLAPRCSPTSPPQPPRASRRSTAPCGPGSRASTTSRPTADSTGAPRSTSGPSQARTCATPGPGTDLDDLFLFEAKRRVMKDRTVSLHGRLYEVDAVLVGETVTLRYDPDARLLGPSSRPRGQLRRHRHPPRRLRQHRRQTPPTSWQLQCDAPPPEPSPSPLTMRNLKEKN